MDRKETEKLERERARLEEARARLEAERQRFEDERQRLEDEKERMEDERERLREEAEEMKEEGREASREKAESRIEELRERAEQMSEARRERLERMGEQIEKAMEGVQEQIENSISGIDFEEVGRKLDRAAKDIEIHVSGFSKNVGVLNLKDITAEELEKMGEIRNAGIIIAPEELIGRVSSKITKNLGTVVPYKKGWRIYSGSTELSREMLEALDEPIDFVQTGYMNVPGDVPADLIKAKVRSFHNYGQISATEATYGILMARCLENYGGITKNGHFGDDDEIPEPPQPPRPPRAPRD